MFSIKTKFKNACSRQVEVPLHFNRQLDPGKQHMPMNRKHIPSLLAVGLYDKTKNRALHCIALDFLPRRTHKSTM